MALYTKKGNTLTKHSGYTVSTEASDCNYNNTTSGLSATDVQDAIDELASGGSSGGHIIENPSGTDMTQRTNLQFVDAHLTDDSVNDRTKVENIKEVDENGWSSASADGFYAVDDNGSTFVPITGGEIAYDANTSINEKIDEMASGGIDFVEFNITNTKSSATLTLDITSYASRLAILIPAHPVYENISTSNDVTVDYSARSHTITLTKPSASYGSEGAKFTVTVGYKRN